MLINVREIGNAGVISDLASWDLPPNGLTNGRNFRVVAGKIQSSGGSQKANLNGPARGPIGHLTQSSDFEGNSTWMACHDSGVDSYNDKQFEGIYDTPGPVSPHEWTSCQIGQVTFLNNPSDYPIYFTDWASGAEQAQRLPAAGAGGMDWEAANVRCRILQSHKNFLFAMGTTEIDPENGQLAYYEDRVRWSNPCQMNGIPYRGRSLGRIDPVLLATRL